MASAQVVETSIANNSPSQDSIRPDDRFQSRYKGNVETRIDVHKCSHDKLKGGKGEFKTRSKTKIQTKLIVLL